ncbi:MAG: hypothetical protein NXI01_02575 [Gammaproteobacteria bacterium]|nr:hypothetical protein [Gammaproteobacteria bacterium]
MDNKESSDVWFDHEDMHFMLSHNLGLRLTDNAKENQNGGFGDAIPLSHLAGAKDIITFVTLAVYLEDHPSNQNLQKTLQDLYHGYTRYNIDKNPERDCLKYLPGLIIIYAQLAKIGDAHLITTETTRLPTSEEKKLSQCYAFSGGALLPIYVFDKTSSYYDPLPNLRLALTENFNQRLQDRLAYNPRFFTQDEMYYALLSSPNPRKFFSASDMDRYPMGKAGKSLFEASNVLQTTPFDKSTALDTHQKNICHWLKDHLNPDSLVPKPIIPMSEPEPTVTLDAPIAQPFYRSPGAVAALIVLGSFAVMKTVEYFQPEDDFECTPR